MGQKVKMFTKKQCESIVKDFESKKEFFKLSKDHGVERISSYEIDVQNLSVKNQNLINNKIKSIIEPITGGEVGMVFGVRYSLDTMSYMRAHYDCNSYSCVITLNDDFHGGGTYFPLTGKIIKPDLGDGYLFKADKINSYHEAYPISNGVRYVLVVRMEKKKEFKILMNMIYLNFVDKIVKNFRKLFYKKPLY